MSPWLAILLFVILLSVIALLMRNFRPAVGPTTLDSGPGVREPRPIRPPVRRGAVAVQEPDDE